MKVLKFVLLAAFFWGPALSESCAVPDELIPAPDSFWIPTLSDASSQHSGVVPPVPGIPKFASPPAQDNRSSQQVHGIQPSEEQMIPYHFPANIDGPVDIQPPELQSQMLFQPGNHAISQLPVAFVHERKTVRVSERNAEIWVKLPRGMRTAVSVNFVEYPPEGDFRIFRTNITTPEPRRFYLSARRWDVNANRWIDLVAMPSLSNEGMQGFDYIDLLPGHRVLVNFENATVRQRVPPVPGQNQEDDLEESLK